MKGGGVEVFIPLDAVTQDLRRRLDAANTANRHLRGDHDYWEAQSRAWEAKYLDASEKIAKLERQCSESQDLCRQSLALLGALGKTP